MFEDRRLTGAALLAIAALPLVYGNHFDNGFHFDDVHTIVNNQYIRSLDNVPAFFTDLATFGTMPNNRAYRPVVTTLNAIDYWLADGLTPWVFHTSIFVAYMLLLGLLAVVFRRTFDRASAEPGNVWLGFMGAVFYGFHAANAETINYVVMRSDSFSTLAMVAALATYQTERGRRYHLYLAPLLVALGTKEVALMFGPLLFLYAFLVEEGGSIIDVVRGRATPALQRSAKAAAPSLLLSIGFFVTQRALFTSDVSVFAGFPSTPWQYFVTQWGVIGHYLVNFLVPLQLSADPDFTIVDSIFNPGSLLGLVAILTLVGIAITTSGKHPPIAFGILWFFFALAPTSSFKPMHQIANDHRTFLPYIGLVAAGMWAARLGVRRWLPWQQSRSRVVAASAFLVVVALHSFGVHARNQVWHDDESLWQDVVHKSPNNGRGLMNYGLTQMRRARYEVAQVYFERALALWPNFSPIHTNLAIVKNAQGRGLQEVESHFKDALRINTHDVSSRYFYGKWLRDRGRHLDAVRVLRKARELSPGESRVTALLGEIEASGTVPELARLERRAQAEPTPENFVNLSLGYYNAGRYRDCIAACERALKLRPDYATAYNNICSAHIKLQNGLEAVKACEEALRLQPEFERARNNLKQARALAAPR